MIDAPGPNDDDADRGSRAATPDEVARRALVLATVACRGILELEPGGGARDLWDRVAPWWASLDLADELEPDEAELLRAPFGEAPGQLSIDASWRAEALAVLVWALGRAELPDHDVPVDAAAYANALGFLDADTVLAAPSLRGASEIEAYRSRAWTVHWRLREFSLRPALLDFASFCRTAWFGPLSLDGVALVEGDLRVGDAPISRAPADAVRITTSIARERHQAVNWLLDAARPLSEADTST